MSSMKFIPIHILKLLYVDYYDVWYCYTKEICVMILLKNSVDILWFYLWW